MKYEANIDASVVILTKNEARNITTAVKSCAEFAEVIVVDSYSTDGTQDIARRMGAHVVDFKWDGKYPKKKEWALGVCSFDWVIYLDADEFFTPPLVEEIRALTSRPDIGGIEVPLEYYWTGRRLAHGHQVTKRIGMHRRKSRWPRPNDLHVKNMWEVEGHYQPVIERGQIGRTNCTLGHRDMDGLYEYFNRHNRYSDWEAHMLEAADAASVAARSRKGRIAANLPCKPVAFFIYSYIAKQGFRDGWAGFDYAMAQTFYYWQIGAKRRELLNYTVTEKQQNESFAAISEANNFDPDQPMLTPQPEVNNKGRAQ